ncbi:MAG: aminotransferase class V-fold PLP-dependent enzyme [Candidatus Thorarchaeota archaeon]
MHNSFYFKDQVIWGNYKLSLEYIHSGSQHGLLETNHIKGRSRANDTMGSPDILDIRGDFNILRTQPNLVYLDAASTALVPTRVVDAMARFLNEVAVSSRRGAYSLATRGAELVELTRKRVAKLTSTEPSMVSFHNTVAETVSSLVYGMSWNRGHRHTIVMAETEDHDTMVPLLRAAQVLGLRVRTIPIGPDYCLDLNQAAALIDNRTGLVAVGCSPVGIGTHNDVQEVSKIAHEHEAIVLSDATRYLGLFEFDVMSVGADVTIVSANNAFLAPPGIVIQWVDKDVAREHVPGILGGSTVTAVTLTSFEPALYPDKFEPGLMSVPGIAGLAEAVDYIVTLGPKRIKSHLQSLSSQLSAGLKELSTVLVYGPVHPHRTTFGFNVGVTEPLNCHDVAMFMDQLGIAVRSGLLCAHPLVSSLSGEGIVQASIHVYNTSEDIDRFLEALEEICSMT